MTVYLEYVLLDNFVIDYLLLKTSLNILGKKPCYFRLFLSASLGAIIALVYPLINIKFISVIIKVLCGVLLTLIVAKYNSKREYYVLTILFFALTFMLGGAIIGIYTIFNIDYSTELSIALIIVPAYVVIKAIKEVIGYIYKRKGVMQNVYKTELFLNGIIVKATGFLDTGNGVYYEDMPVIFINKKISKKFFEGYSLPKMVKVRVGTISGKSSLYGFRLESIKLYIERKENIIEKVIACVVPKSVGVGYDVILHPDLVEGKYEVESTCSGERVS